MSEIALPPDSFNIFSKMPQKQKLMRLSELWRLIFRSWWLMSTQTTWCKNYFPNVIFIKEGSSSENFSPICQQCQERLKEHTLFNLLYCFWLRRRKKYSWLRAFYLLLCRILCSLIQHTSFRRWWHFSLFQLHCPSSSWPCTISSTFLSIKMQSAFWRGCLASWERVKNVIHHVLRSWGIDSYKL